MNDYVKGEQALRVLDAIEAALAAGAHIRGISYAGRERYVVRVYSPRSDTGCETTHRGTSLLDALSQYAQAEVMWSEPDEHDEPADEALKRYQAEGML